MNRTLKKENLLPLLYCALLAFLLLLLCSRSSFLYACNDWNDANSYFSVGKAIFHGKVPYRDVFDQKGPYLYFFYGLAYLLSHTTFIGVFLMEILCIGIYLFGCYRILTLVTKPRLALGLLPILGAVTLSANSFYYGGSAEEVCLPFLIWGLYLSLHYFKNEYPKPMSCRTLYIAGILAGMVALIKFTVLGFFFAWMAMIALSCLLRKDILNMLRSCGIFLLGMLTTAVPWILYFGLHHAIGDWFNGYVYINVCVYSNLNGEGPTLMERIYTLTKLLYWVAIKNLPYFLFTIIGVLGYLISPRVKLLQKLNLLALCGFLFLGIYVGGSELPYYAMPLAVFAVLGFIVLGYVIQKLTDKITLSLSAKNMIAALLYLFSILVSLGFAYHTSMNTDYLQVKKEDHFLTKFTDDINTSGIEQPTLLNIGCLDAGLYTVADIVPTCRWFQTQTLPIPDVLDSQERYIREGQISFVIARDTYPDVIWERYDLLDEQKWTENGTEFTYYLFQLKD